MVLGLDGSVRMGVRRARRTPTEPAWVGSSARERARQAKLAALAVEAARSTAALSDCRLAGEELERQSAAARSEFAAMPDDGAWMTALQSLQRAEVDVAGRREAWRRAEEVLDERRLDAAEARAKAGSFLRDHDLPDAEGRSELRDRLESLRDRVRELPGLARSVERRTGELEQAVGEAEGQSSGLVALGKRLQRAREQLLEREEALEVVRATEGPQLAEREHELQVATEAQRDVGTHLTELEGQGTALARRSGKLEVRAEDVARGAERAQQRRHETRGRFADLGTHDILRQAGVTPAGTDPDSLLAAAQGAAGQGHQGGRPLYGLYNDVNAGIARLREQLATSAGYHISHERAERDGDLLLVSISTGAGPMRPDALVESLQNELAGLQSSVSEAEQELMHQWIVDGLAAALADRLHEVREQVERTNRVLAGCRTHFGIRVSLRWAPTAEGGDALAETLKLLGEGTDLLDPERQRRLGRNLQTLIDAERDRGEGSTAEQIARALDYRAWHRFWIMRHQEGRPTQAAHQPHDHRRLRRRARDDAPAPAAGRRGRVLRGGGQAVPAPDRARRGLRGRRRTPLPPDVHRARRARPRLHARLVQAAPVRPDHRLALIILRRFEEQHVVVGQRSVWTGSELIADRPTPT